MADRIKGITVVLGGDTTGLNKALKGTNKEIKNTQSQLKDVEKLLKLDPTNTKLLEQRQRLLADAVNETKGKLETLKTAEKQVQEQFKQGKVSQEQYDGLQREIAATQQELKRLEDQASKSNAVLSKIGETSNKVGAGAKKIADGTKAASTAAGGVLAVAGASTVAFEQDFAKLSTVLNDATTDYDAYKKSVLDGAKKMSIAPKEFTEATYSAISASVDQAKAVEFTAKAAKLAKGGFTDLTKSVDVLTTAINGYGLSANDAAKISDLLITTQNLGKTTVDELASSMGAVIPVAASANFGIDELSAAYAQLTKNGIATSESGTYVKSMLSELTKSGSVADKALRRLTQKGFAELKAEGVPTADILNMLSETAEKNGKTLKDMFGSVEAGSAAMVLSKNNGEEFNAMLSAMQDSAGATDKAFEKVSETTGAKMAKSFNDMKVSAINLGDAVAPIIAMVSDLIENMTSNISSMDEEQMKAIAIVLAVIAAISPVAGIISGISTTIGVLTQWISFLISNPIVLLIAAIVALVALIGIKGDEIQAILQKVDDFLQGVFARDWTEVFGPVFGNILNTFFANFKNIWNAVKQIFNGVIDFIRGVFTGNWERAWRGAVDIFGGLFHGLTALVKAPLNGVIGLINGAIGAINGLVNGFNSIGFDMPKWLGGGSWHPSIPNIPNVPYLAKGGILSKGTAVVGEAGPELLTMSQGRTIVQPLTNNNTTNHNLGGVNINVYGAPGQDVHELANIVMDQIEGATARKAAVF